MIGAAISMMSSAARSGMPTSDIRIMQFLRGLGGSWSTSSIGNAAVLFMGSLFNGVIRDGDCLFEPDFGGFHYLCPQRAFALDTRRKFLGRSGDGLGANIEQLLAHVRQRDDASDVTLRFRNDFGWRAGGRDKAEPYVGVETGQAAFGNCRNFG